MRSVHERIRREEWFMLGCVVLVGLLVGAVLYLYPEVFSPVIESTP